MEETKKESKLIAIFGVESVGKQFLYEALAQIIIKSGYSVNLEPFGTDHETDFHIILCDEFSIEQEAKSKLLFGCYSKPEDIIHKEAPEGMVDSEDWKEYYDGAKFNLLDRFYELAKWMRTSKLAYVMDLDSPMNANGLHHYNNLRNIILPLNFAFQNENMRFDKIKPTDLIESLMPDLKEKSKVAEGKFNVVRDEKIKGA